MTPTITDEAVSLNRRAMRGAWDKSEVLLCTPWELARERDTDQKRKASPPLVVPQSWELVQLGVKPDFYVRVQGRTQIVRSSTVRKWDVESKVFKYLRETYKVDKTTRAKKKRTRRALNRNIRSARAEIAHFEGLGIKTAFRTAKAKRRLHALLDS